MNEAHELEAWGDARAFDGTVTILQPLVEPLYGGKSALEVLAAALGQPAAKGLDLLRAHWQKQHPDGFDAFFRKSLHDGFVEGSALTARALKPAANVPAPAAAPAPESAGLEVVFRPDPGIFDGRFANNGWLQEVPKPLTKLTWDNAAHMSLATAKRLGVKNEDLVAIAAAGATLAAPVWILPGQPDDVVTLHFGHGRTRAGRVGNGTGVNAYRIRAATGLWLATASVEKAGGHLRARHDAAPLQHGRAPPRPHGHVRGVPQGP